MIIRNIPNGIQYSQLTPEHLEVLMCDAGIRIATIFANMALSMEIESLELD